MKEKEPNRIPHLVFSLLFCWLNSSTLLIIINDINSLAQIPLDLLNSSPSPHTPPSLPIISYIYDMIILIILSVVVSYCIKKHTYFFEGRYSAPRLLATSPIGTRSEIFPKIDFSRTKDLIEPVNPVGSVLRAIIASLALFSPASASDIFFRKEAST